MLKLNWSKPSPPCSGCCYDHVIGETPFGRFLLTWKSWKEPWNMGMGFDETPWGEVIYDGWDSVEEAQLWAESEMRKRCKELLLVLGD